jgi:chaperonin cofactor prefoldin
MKTVEKAALIRLKVSALLQQVTQLQKKLEEAHLEREKLEIKLQEQTKKLEILEDKNKISKLAVGIQLGKHHKLEMKQAINQYVREIDECLKLLNQIPNNH